MCKHVNYLKIKNKIVKYISFKYKMYILYIKYYYNSIQK